LLEVFNNSNVALVGPKIIEDNKRLHWQGYFLKRINFFSYIAFLTPLREIFVKTKMAVEPVLQKGEKPFKVYAIPGCCMLFSSDILAKIGMFDENTFLGWEECIIAEKLLKYQYATYVVPKSVIFHKVTKDSALIPLHKRKKSYLESERYFQINYLKMPLYQRFLLSFFREVSFFMMAVLYKMIFSLFSRKKDWE